MTSKIISCTQSKKIAHNRLALLILGLLSFLITASAHANIVFSKEIQTASSPAMIANPISTETPTTLYSATATSNIMPAPIKRIEISGPIDLEMVSQGQPNEVTLQGGPAAQWVQKSFVNNTLKIWYGYPASTNKLGADVKKTPTPPIPVIRPLVCVNAPELTSLTYNGTGVVDTRALSGKNLNVDIPNAKQVRMQGQMDVQRLSYGGNTHTTLYWINTPTLSITGSGHSVINLAGVVGDLTVMLSGNSYLNARYLRAKTIFVNTADNARADVSPLINLNAFATGHSNIYYFNDPLYIHDYRYEDGDILRMVGLTPPEAPGGDTLGWQSN